jgi:heavy metal sensor kinase
MRSIRLAMIVYFLLLVGGALGAVSWFVYQTTSQTLQAKEASAKRNLEILYQAECTKAQQRLDERLLPQARILAGLARPSRVHMETLMFPLGILGTVAQPEAHLSVPLWWGEGCYLVLASRLYREHLRELARAGWDPDYVHIESAEDVMPLPEEGQPEEYFQTYNSRGKPLERSSSMKDSWFGLDQEIRKKVEQDGEYFFDTTELRPGVEVRRVTVKLPILRGRFRGPDVDQRPRFMPGLWLMPGARPRFDENRPVGEMKPAPKGPLENRPVGDMKPPPKGLLPPPPTPTAIIQYARDTTDLKKSLRQFGEKLQDDLAQEKQETGQALAALRTRLAWIFGLTFLAVVAGGYWLVQLGLIPLRRLSDAVSRVSEKDFRLQIDHNRLPSELRPIASRLAETLDQLKRAFAREKQAAADISHELRTPLAALLTTLDVALRKPRSVQEYQEILEDCQASGKQMTQLVERLLALARLDAGVDTLRPREVDVVNLASQCADLVRPLADARGVALRLHTSGAAVMRTDPDKLREVLNNLLHNAIEYNRPNGSIDVAVERQNGHLCLEVRDTGIGIAPEAREHIFERFYRADPSRHAETDNMHAGIGLAIVKGYVDLMGGSIDVDSSDAGSTFRVEFPVL